MPRSLTPLIVLAALVKLAAAANYTYVPIPATDNIQTALISTIPTGIFTTSNAIPFSIPDTPGKCGPSAAAPCNYYDGFGVSGSGQSVTLKVSIVGATDIYTLMNAYSPPPGVQLATITFAGTGGASVTFPLVAGQDIRDYHQGPFANTLSNGIAGVDAVNVLTCVDPTNCLGSGATGNVQTGRPGTYVADEQHFSLGSTFAGQTLTQIILTDTHDGAVPILLGVTVASQGIPAIGGVVSASDYGKLPDTAPGSQIEIYGSNLARDTHGWGAADFTNGIGPISLDGTSVTIGGKSAFVDYINPGQVNVVVPSDVPTGAQEITLKTDQGTSAAYSIMVNALEPGLLAPLSYKIDGTQYVFAVLPDGDHALPSSTGPTSRPARPGDILVLYGIGFGPVLPDIPAGQLVEQTNMLASILEISIGGMPASLQFAGLIQNLTGLYQFNVVVPNAAAGNAPLTFTVGGVAGTQTLYLAVGN
jgi:uncharacterized protein (TIGR03437 family)